MTLVGQVVPPEGRHALLLGDARDTIHDAPVLLVGRDLLTGMLHLYQYFDHWIGARAVLEIKAAAPLGQDVFGKGGGAFSPLGAGGGELHQA